MILGIPLLLASTLVLSANGQPPEEPPANAQADQIDPSVMQDPTVRGVMASNPTTPGELVRAVRVLSRLDRPRAARLLIQRFFRTNPDSATLATLAERFGTGLFSGFRLSPALQPEGSRLASAVLDAFHKTVTDPQQLVAAIDLLGDASPEKRKAALLRLRSAGPAAATVLISALADPRRAESYPLIEQALVLLGRDAADPLIAALESGNAELNGRIATVLGQLDATEALAFLLAPALGSTDNVTYREAASQAVVWLYGKLPSRKEAVDFLMHKARRLYAAVPTLTADERQGNLWRWDPAQQKLVVERATRRRIDIEAARRMITDAMVLAPAKTSLKRLRLAVLLEGAVLRHGWEVNLENDEPAAWHAALEAGPKSMLDLLAQAQRERHLATAVLAARILGLMGRVEVLHARAPYPSALTAALRQADERLRFTALEAIMRLDPVRPFPGSSHVPEVLAYFAAWQGPPLALVAHPRMAEARRLAGLLNELGYRTEIATEGRALFSLAVDSSDTELVLLAMTLNRPSTAMLVEELRRDSRTAGLPIGLIAGEDQLDQARRLADGDLLGEAMIRPHSVEAIKLLTRRLRQAADWQLATRQERRTFATQSLAWLADLSGRPQSLYPLQRFDVVLERALFVPKLQRQAIQALSHISTPRAQRVLVELASRATWPIEPRRAAADAFSENVRQGGILLTSDEILRQYDRYNASEEQDPATQAVLASILDTLERKQQSTGGAETSGS